MAFSDARRGNFACDSGLVDSCVTGHRICLFGNIRVASRLGPRSADLSMFKQKRGMTAFTILVCHIGSWCIALNSSALAFHFLMARSHNILFNDSMRLQSRYMHSLMCYVRAFAYFTLYFKSTSICHPLRPPFFLPRVTQAGPVSHIICVYSCCP